MTYEQFWDGDAEMVRDFRFAYKRRLEQQNRMMWLQGLYVYRAIDAIMPALSIKTQNVGIKPYLDEPIPITQDEEEEREIRKQKLQFEQNQARFKALANKFNANLNKKEDTK